MDSKPKTAAYKHAVVIGGSIAGLMAAKVLSETFNKVTVLDKDTPPDKSEVRKGAPQGAHAHVVLESGREIMEKFYPGLTEEMESGGANIADTANHVAWFHHGVWKMRYKSGIKLTLASRPFLEWNIRQRTAQVPNIQIINETTVADLLSSEDNNTILGVKITKTGNSSNITNLQADLVVDATGRGSRAPIWLTDMGYESPKEEHIGVNLSYTSRMFEKPARFKKGLFWVPVGEFMHTGIQCL